MSVLLEEESQADSNSKIKYNNTYTFIIIAKKSKPNLSIVGIEAKIPLNQQKIITEEVLLIYQ
ncbi:MAG: hypothetical protein ACM3VV_08015 [Deltaproteobacteria bacterium]